MSTAQLTNQKAFNRVAKHLLTQKKKCRGMFDGAPTCLYRGEEGLACAIGALIPDKLYHPRFEGKSAYTLFADYALDYGDDTSEGKKVEKLHKQLLNYFANVDIGLLQRLQEVHDESKPNRWPAKLRRVAKNYALKLPPELKAA